MIDVFAPTKKKAEKLFRQAMQSGELGPAISYYRKYLDQNEGDYEGQNDLGWMLMQAGRPEEALDCFEAANAVEESAVHWDNQGQALLKLERFEEADEAFEAAMRLDPEDPEPPYHRAASLRAQEDLEGCMTALEEVIEQHPDFAPALNDYGLCLNEVEREDEAVDYLERAVEESPMWIPARLNAIRTLCDLGRYPEATVHLEELDEMGADIVIDLGEDDVAISLNGQPIYQGELVEGVPGFGE